jgi:hypothetical protein
MDQGGNAGVRLNVQSDGSAVPEVADQAGKGRILLGVRPDSTPYLNLRDKDGKVIWKAP